MVDTSYRRVGSKKIVIGRFRINLKRFSVQRLRSKYMSLWSSCGQALSSLKRGFARRTRAVGVFGQGYCKYDRNNVNDGLARDYYYPIEFRSRSVGRSDSFYAEAIDDCLEFIKRSSVSVDH